MGARLTSLYTDTSLDPGVTEVTSVEAGWHVC